MCGGSDRTSASMGPHARGRTPSPSYVIETLCVRYKDPIRTVTDIGSLGWSLPNVLVWVSCCR